MQHTDLNRLLEELSALKPAMQGQDLLLTWQKSDEEIRSILLVTEILQELHRQRRDTRIFSSGLGISIFRDNSTRTRFSYAGAVNMLGLGLSELDEDKSQVAHGETLMETANMISFLAEAVGIRDDMYLGAGHSYMEEFAAALDFGHDMGVLAQRPTLVNLQSDIDHPTQTLADLSMLKYFFGDLEALKGKKIAMTWAYSPSYGKPLSVPQGVIGLMTRFGMDVTLAHPEGYGLIPEVMDVAGRNAEASGGSFTVSNSMAEAFKDADIVYPKSWAPYHVMEERTELLKAADREGLKDLEKRCLVNNAKFIDWECDRDMMDLTVGKKALYQHCLPADITGVSCRQGEVSAEVFEEYKLATYRQAGFKPFVIAANILLSRMRDPVATLRDLAGRS